MKRRVLIVDDNADLQEDIRLTLTPKYQETLDIVQLHSLSELKTHLDVSASNQSKVADIIYLDLKLHTREEGIEALGSLKSHEMADVKRIPTIMYTESDDLRDVNEAYQLGANAYIEKGDDGLGSLEESWAYWLERCRIPGEDRAKS